MSCTAAAAALASLLGLGACTEAARPGASQPSFYADLGQPGARVDAPEARAMISAYRMNAGLGRLQLDSELQAAAQREADAMARSDRPSSAEAVKRRLSAAGFSRPDANLSAGYRTLAEAFSGWRDSGQHDRVMKAPSAKRMGIATAHAPGSKYQVYWALVLAE
jgi:uncharacterized protein YkwD